MMKTNAELEKLKAAYEAAWAAYDGAAIGAYDADHASPLHFVCPERR